MSVVQLLILLLCTVSSLYAKYDLAMCAIFQDEAPWLKEWLEFHFLQGVEHVYLYNNNSHDNYLQVLDPYVKRGRVTLTEWSFTYEDQAHKDWIAIQCGAYMDCIKRFGKKANWMAFIDVDEFLFCPNGTKLSKFLTGYKEYAGLGVNWLKFGTSGIEEIPAGSLMIECLTHCLEPEHKENRFYKSIVQPKYVLGCPTSHYFAYKGGKYAVGADKKKIKPNKMRKTPILLDQIRINHYITRTVRFFREVKIPSRQKRRARYTPEFQLSLADRYNQCTDTAILPNVAPLRKAMG